MKTLVRFFAILGTFAALTIAPHVYAENLNPNADSAKAVNHLIERYIDAQKGFLDASEEVDDSGLKRFFTDKSAQRKAFSEDLQNAMIKAGLKYETTGSAEAAAHRAWIDIKSIVTGKDDIAVLNAVRTGEEEAVKSYKDVLGQPLNDDLRNLVQKQFEDVLDSFTKVNEEIKDRTRDIEVDVDNN